MIIGRIQILTVCFAFLSGSLLPGCDGNDSVNASSAALGDVSGSVRQASTSQPLSGVTVKCAGRSSVTDSQGLYHVQEVPVGVHAITAQREGYQFYSSVIDVRPGLTHDIALSLAYGSVFGWVFRAGTSQPVPGAIVGCVGKSSVSDQNGRYSLAGIPQGVQVISAVTAKGDYHPYRGEVNVIGQTSHTIYLIPMSR